MIINNCLVLFSLDTRPVMDDLQAQLMLQMLLEEEQGVKEDEDEVQQAV